MKKLLLPIVGAALFIIAVGFLTKYLEGKPVIRTSIPSSKKEVIVGSAKLNVDVADTEGERSRGLSGIESLGEAEGLLFVFPQKDVDTAFWMKGMKISIDIIWIDDDKVVYIDKKAAPEPGVPDSKLKLYRPYQAIDFVLEVNAGWSDKNGVRVGDSVDLSKAL